MACNLSLAKLSNRPRFLVFVAVYEGMCVAHVTLTLTHTLNARADDGAKAAPAYADRCVGATSGRGDGRTERVATDADDGRRCRVDTPTTTTYTKGIQVSTFIFAVNDNSVYR